MQQLRSRCTGWSRRPSATRCSRTPTATTTMHEVHKVLVGARPRQGDTDDPENWARYDLIWPHLGPSEVWNCDDEETRQLLIDRVRYLWKRGDFEEALEVGARARGAVAGEDRAGRRADPVPALPHRQRAALPGPVPGGATSWTPQIYAQAAGGARRRPPVHPADRGQPRRRPARARPIPRGARAGRGDLRAATRSCSAPTTRTRCQARTTSPSTCAWWATASGPATSTAETLNYRQVVLGPDHPYTLHSASMLARDMREAGDYAGSVDLLRETYERYLARPRRGLRGHAAHRARAWRSRCGSWASSTRPTS